MDTVVDFHSHILPGIDDGSASVEESLAMLKMAAEQGIRRMVATPHFYPHRDDPERFLRRRREAEFRLREAMEACDGLPELEMGAEVYFFRGMSAYERLCDLTIEGTDCVLVEMPMSRWTDSMYAELKKIHSEMGLIPIVAHMDRYISPFRTHGIPQMLAELPVIVQANANFFLRSSTRSMALKLLKEDKIHLLGSDCHNTEERKPNLGPATEIILQRLGPNTIKRVHSYENYVLCEST